MGTPFKPHILAFLCKWCGYAGADMAGTSRLKYPPSIVPIQVPCSGRIKMEHVLEALTKSDGVLIAGCHVPSDCHYVSGNFKCLKRVTLLKKLLMQIGINPARVRLEWISATEGRKFARVVREFTRELEELGPLNLAENYGGNGDKRE
ncbi:MAG: hydrogenase iron-sulfur subunit [Candidatus Bathyarchaeia archaeon]|nr:hydrogenase iron-sulfur subunit [Candidatus Bathyarchaeia archaeon]